MTTPDARTGGSTATVGTRTASGNGRPINVVFVPSVSGGLGHVTRTVKLARALERADPRLRISYALSERKLRRFNVEAVERTGYPVRILPDPVHHQRDREIRAALGEADVVIDDTERRLVAYRRILPRIRAWISIPMLPLWDELFMDWPRLEHVDHIIYAYPPSMPVPEDLAPFREKLTVSGPILDPDEMPDRTAARRRLGLPEGRRYVLYAPRGFPFGREFGRRVVNGVVGGFLRLRRRHPELRLILTAAPDPGAIRPPGLPPLDRIDGLTVHGVLPSEAARDYLAAADVTVVEGTSALFDAAMARAPVVMVPGPIHETRLEGSLLRERDAGLVLDVADVTRVTMGRAIRQALEPEGAAVRAARLRELIGTDGRERAVEAVLRVIAERVPA